MLFKRKNTDGLKLHRTLPGQLLTLLVAAMSFLAALTIAGAYASQQLANRWNAGAASTVIIQIPQPDTSTVNDGTQTRGIPSQTRIRSVIALLSASHELISFHRLTDDEINQLLSPWLHENIQSLALPIPAIIELRLNNNVPISNTLKTSLQTIAPDIMIEQSNFWNRRLNALANSLQTSAFLALFIVILVSASVVALSTRTGLIQCKQTIEILHNLGASDNYISFRFAKRNASLALIGGSIGSVFSIPLLLFLTYLCLPFSSDPNWQTLANDGWFYFLTKIPFSLLMLFPLLPICSYLIGWITTTIIVYFWLRHLT